MRFWAADEVAVLSLLLQVVVEVPRRLGQGDFHHDDVHGGEEADRLFGQVGRGLLHGGEEPSELAVLAFASIVLDVVAQAEQPQEVVHHRVLPVVGERRIQGVRFEAAFPEFQTDPVDQRLNGSGNREAERMSPDPALERPLLHVGVPCA